MDAYMWTQAGHETADYWYCVNCPEWQLKADGGSAPAEHHVRETGHTVKIRHESERTLTGVMC